MDFIPVDLLKACSLVLAPMIAHLANMCFDEGRFPTAFKHAQVTPILKKPGLDGTEPANYRPISNLNVISKILERLVLARLTAHVSNSPNLNSLQSVYRAGHSTETALLKVTDDLYRIMDRSCAAVLIVLDLSAAFDTIDHDRLAERLR